MAFHEHNPALFTQGNLSYALEAHVKKAAEYVGNIPQPQFLGSTDEEIVASAVAELEILPLELHVDKRVVEYEEAQVDVSHEPNRMFFDHEGPFYVPGTQLTISIPYTGQAELWNIAPGHFWVTHPRANVLPPNSDGIGTIEIVIHQAGDVASAEPVESLLNDTLRDLEKCLQAQRAEIERRNAEIPAVVRQAIQLRRRTLQRGDILVAALKIPLKQRADAPEITTIPIRRRLKRPLPSPPRSGEEPQLGIADDDYEHILAVIRHEGRTFEATPATYRGLGEEDLRSILLAHLNGHYEGAATGETFRREGKTDIRIEDGNRAAFVAECKLWRGPAEASAALDQLLSYLTWRDAKAALVIFNKQAARFTEIVAKMPDVLRSHPLFREDLGAKHPGEWRTLFSSSRDPDSYVIVHTFLFNLYTHDQ